MIGLTKTTAGLICCVMVINPGFSQQPPDPAVTQVADNIYMINIGIANAGFIVGETEVLFVDAEMTSDAAAQMLKAIKK